MVERMQRFVNWLLRPINALGDRLTVVVGPEGPYFAGVYYMRQGNFARAGEAFEEAERAYRRTHGESHPRVSEAMSYRAWCYVKAGHAENALSLYERAIQLDTARGDPTGARLRQLTKELAWARTKARGS